MKPKLKPRRGWRYRVIVCDNQGLYEFDDVMIGSNVDACARKLFAALQLKIVNAIRETHS